VFSEECWRQRKDGSLFWAFVIITALRLDDGALQGFSKVTIDLTRHKVLEQCEQEKQEIDQILVASESGTWKCRLDSGEMRVSPHLAALLGYEDDQPALDLEHWLGYVHEDDRGALRARLDQARAAPGTAPFETELRLLRRDGNYQWFYLRANWQGGQAGQAAELMGVCVTIDSLKRAERDKDQAIEALRIERARFADILEQLPSGVVLAEVPSGKLTYQNRAAVAMLGGDMTDIQSFREYDRYHFIGPGGERLGYQDLPLTRLMTGGAAAPQLQELLYLRPDGRRTHLAVMAAPILDHDGVARLAVAVMHDIGQLKQAELNAETERERALVTLAAITDGVITVNPAGAIGSMNPAAEAFTGVGAEQARGQPVGTVVHFEESTGAASLDAALAQCLAERRAVTSLPHLTMRGHAGVSHSVESAVSPVSLADGELIGAVLIFHDVTESKRLLRRLGFEASHDALTGLINRREFEERLQRAIERAHHHGGAHAALLYLDLDQFKIVNDTCGHSAGDDLLKQLARSYSGHVRERDTLARIGGDEFALIVEHCDLDEALAVAHKLLEDTRAFRYVCKDRVFQLGVSIGLTPIDQRTTGVEEAMQRADHACYIAKERGRNRVFVHALGDLDLAQRRSDMDWVARLSHAFQHDELQLYYQPIIALGAPDPDQHYEILLRLRDGDAGPISPGSFLPAAERYDLILKVDRWVLTRTLAWLTESPEHTDTLGMCSINLSRRSLADPSFHKFAARLIDEARVPASKLCFEITEHGAIADMHNTVAFIEALAARGCRFSLDDFGTGMTSFTYLKQLPVDYIKIDGSFIQMMGSSEVDFEMVRFTNDISHMMGRRTIAEYVTDPAILASLKRIGVDYAQGYWLGKPRPLTP